MNHLERVNLQKFAANIRLGILRAVHAAQSGHPGGALSIADTLAYLYSHVMRYDPANPRDPNRDRFVLSKGHASAALYAVLSLVGFFDEEELLGFRKIDRMLQGHPDMKGTPGVDMTTGSLGQGFSAACGMAIAGKVRHADFRVFAILGDGELQEGQIWEAAMFASAKKLDNLIAIVDHNGLQIDGDIEEVNSPYPIREKFVAFGWHTIAADAHDFDSLDSAFSEAISLLGKGMPIVIIQESVKGKGVSFMENRADWHGKAPNDEQFAKATEELSSSIKTMEELQ